MSFLAGVVSGARRRLPAAVPEPVITAIFNSTYLPTGYTFTNGDRTVENTSKGDNAPAFCPVTVPILDVSENKRYWEVSCDALGPGTAATYAGAVRTSELPKYNTNNLGGTSYCLAWRQNGTFWFNTVQAVTGLPTWGAGDVLMFAIRQTSSTFIWVGKNGVWHEADPSTEANPVYSVTHLEYWPAAQCRDQGDRFTFRGDAHLFSYPIPTGFSALAA